MARLRIVNVISTPVAPLGAAGGEAIARIIRATAEAQKRHAMPAGTRYAVGGVVGRPDLTIWRRSTGVRRCIHRFGRWLLTL